LTAARAGYLDALNGHIAQTGDSYAIVNSGTHGNAALKVLIDAVDAVVDDILLDTDELQTDNIPGLIGALEDLSAAQANAEMVDALATDTYAEPGQGAPSATTNLAEKIGYIHKFLRNKIVTDSTTIEVYNDAGTVVDQKSTIGDDGTDFTRGKFGSGP
jgi:hypothetical protein